ncbi:hypothetical protein LCGC14_2266160 [marine sediment metagenome]|uniref:Uncharacterized protein n=1 Tax=marine sediment metagenome TaxID=412755 RepID=A0A0F9CYE8_9ZZZZ
MNRRTFIKGLIAAGVLLATPLEGLSEAFTRKYMTATDMLNNEQEFMKYRRFGKTDRVIELYQEALVRQLQTPDIKWFSLEQSDNDITNMVLDNYRKAKAIHAKTH